MHRSYQHGKWRTSCRDRRTMIGSTLGQRWLLALDTLIHVYVHASWCNRDEDKGQTIYYQMRASHRDMRGRGLFHHSGSVERWLVAAMRYPTIYQCEVVTRRLKAHVVYIVIHHTLAQKPEETGEFNDKIGSTRSAAQATICSPSNEMEGKYSKIWSKSKVRTAKR